MRNRAAGRLWPADRRAVVAAAAGPSPRVPVLPALVPGYLSLDTGVAGTGGAPAPAGAAPAAPAAGWPSRTARRCAGAAPPLAATAPVPPRGRVVAGAALFVLGFSLVFVAHGAALGGLGQLLTGHARLLTQVLGGLTVVLGLLFAGALDRNSFAGRMVRPCAASGGAGRGVAARRDVRARLGPLLGPTLDRRVAMSASTGTVARGALLAFVLPSAWGIPFLLVSFGFQVAMRACAFFRRRARLVTRIGGAMLVGVGLLEVTGAWSSFMAWLQVHSVSSYQPPI